MVKIEVENWGVGVDISNLLHRQGIGSALNMHDNITTIEVIKGSYKKALKIIEGYNGN